MVKAAPRGVLRWDLLGLGIDLLMMLLVGLGARVSGMTGRTIGWREESEEWKKSVPLSSCNKSGKGSIMKPALAIVA